MAVVPVSQGATIDNRPLAFVPQQAQFDPSAFGAGVGQAVQGLGKAVGADAEEAAKIATSMAIQNDVRAAKVSDTQHQKNVTDLGFVSLPDGPAGNKGYYSLQGQDAVTYRPAYEKALNDSNTAISDGLKDSPRAQNFYNAQAGMRVQGEVQRSAQYANHQGLIADNNASAARVSGYKDSLTVNYNDPDALANFQKVTRGEIADTGRRMGWSSDQTAEATTKALSSGYRDAILSRVTSGDVNGGAAMFQQLAPGMDAATRVSLAQHLQPIVTGATADNLVQSLLGKATPRTAASAPDIYGAIHAQEGPGVSIQGANDGIMPQTFAQYAKQGESFSSPADRATVNKRIIDDLSAKAGGDPERIAVGYFSGPGNMSAPGAATPFIHDRADANGKTVSSYVADINRRLGRQPGPPAGDATDANPAIHPDFAGVQQKLLDATAGDTKLRNAALSRLHAASAQYELSTQADRDKIEKNWNDTVASATAGNDKVSIDEAMIRHAYRPEKADYMIGQYHEAVTAGQLNGALALATPAQVNSIMGDLASGIGPRATMDHLRGKTVSGVPVAGKDGPPDMSDKYNTKLSPEEETKFQAWGAANTKDGRNPAADTFDYDMRGFWKAGDGNPTFADNGHAGDQFKKPNHPTFSDQSQYSGQDGFTGGKWSGDGQAKSYTPSETNLAMHGEGDLQHYFAEREPDYKLNGPAEDPAHYLQRQKALASARTFLDNRTKMLSADPASYVMQDPNVAAAYKAVDPTKPETLQAAVDSSLSSQRTLGVEAPRVLTTAQAAQTVKSLQTQSIEKVDVGNQLNKLQDQYGPHYGAVVADMVKAGLNPDYQMLAHANLPEQATVREDLQRALQMKDSLKDKAEFGAAVPADQKRLLTPAIDAALEGFRQTTMPYSDSTTFDSVVHPAISTLATYYAGKGYKAQDAVDKAAELITKSYDFDGMLRAPKGKIGDVQQAGATLQANLSDADLKGTTAAEARAGKWVTRPDDAGVYLLKGTTQGGFMPVRKADGSVVGFDFKNMPKADFGAYTPGLSQQANQ